VEQQQQQQQQQQQGVEWSSALAPDFVKLHWPVSCGVGGQEGQRPPQQQRQPLLQLGTFLQLH
jgi:hypothetical protein